MRGTPADDEAQVLPPLLRLPPRLRRRIYGLVGPEPWNGFAHTFYLQGRDPYLAETRTSRHTDSYLHAFRGLLLCCRLIHDEATALLYSTNRFIIHYTGPGSLAPLLSLAEPTLAALGSLKIVLNEASCHQRAESEREMDCCIPPIDVPECHGSWFRIDHRHQPPLLTPSAACESGDQTEDVLFAATQALLGEWRAAAGYLSSFVTPGALEFGLVCDIDPRHERAAELAAAVVAPLRLLPRLRDCHIRLAKTPDARLSQLAAQAALEARGLPPPKPPVSTRPAFLALPRELRFRILELTDLVTPNQEVWWCRQDSKYAWSDRSGGLHCDNRNFSPPCSFLECWYRTRHAVRHGMEGMPFGCFCRRRHAASSTACSCWLPPAPLFLVCRAICQDAEFVFFSENRFIVYDLTTKPWRLSGPGFKAAFAKHCENLSSEYPFPRLAASHFLRDAVPARCIGHLRFLEIVMPPYSAAAWPQYGHPAMQDWRETVSWFRDRMNGPALTLRVLAADDWDVEAAGTPRDWITVAEADMIDKGYMTLLHPLAHLAKGPTALARFYGGVRYPWQSTNREMGTITRRKWVETGKVGVKRRAECLVLGNRYNNQYADGKEEPERSLWQHIFGDHP